MDKKYRKRKCRFCKEYFLSDVRNAWHQEFCKKPQCRKASKANSQKKWLQKKENKDYFRGSENVRRVQQWRKAHPGYWKNRKNHPQNALQDHSKEECHEKQSVVSPVISNALQDLLTPQPAVLIGLIAHITGNALQDEIADTTSRLKQLGNDILNFKGGEKNENISDISRECTAYPPSVQLGRPSPGP